jgi:hypothetical protein
LAEREKEIVFVFSAGQILTVGENIIATTKIRNNYGAIQSFKFLILRNSIYCPLYSLLASFLVLDLCFFFDGFLSKVIALPTIAIAIVVVLSRS